MGFPSVLKFSWQAHIGYDQSGHLLPVICQLAASLPTTGHDHKAQVAEGIPGSYRTWNEGPDGEAAETDALLGGFAQEDSHDDLTTGVNQQREIRRRTCH